VPGAMYLERQVVLLSRDIGLASIVGLTLANGDRVAHLQSPGAMAEWSPTAVAAVVLDSRPPNHQLSYKQVRDRYRGPLVMLLDRDEGPPNLPPDGARRFLRRPFSATDLGAVLATAPAELGPLENAIIDSWVRHAAPDPPPPRPDGLAYRTSWKPSTRRRLRIWVASVAAMLGLLMVFNLSGQDSCGPGCTSIGPSVAGASESRTPLTSRPPSQGGGGRGGGQSSTPASDPGTTPGGVPLAAGIGDLIQSINPITPTDTTPLSAPEPVPGVPSPAPPPGTTPPTTPPPGTTPPTTPPPTTAPPTTPPTTAPPTTAPPTTPPTTAPPTQPPTTAPPPTEPPTTAPPPTEPPTTAPPPTEPPTTAPPATAAPTTASPAT
jgi:hypothetical protein